MARRPTAPPVPQPPVALAYPRLQVEQRIKERIDLGRELQGRSPRTHQELQMFHDDAIKWDDYNEELLKRLFTNDSVSKEYSQLFVGVLTDSPGKRLQARQEDVARSVRILESVVGRLDLYPEPSEAASVARSAAAVAVPRNFSKVFVVHGHDEAALQVVARFLEQLGLEAIILREQPDRGRTIIEKFEDCANEVGFAVVLLTPDDLAHTEGASHEANRARQNVIFELGYFTGKLGRGRACLLRKGDVEIPSDLYGVIYTELDAAGGWKMTLVREMKAARLDFDANRMWR